MTPGREGVIFRLAGPADAPAVARLHAASWRAHYRGSLSDAYLDGPIEEERLRVWTERLAVAGPDPTVVLAEQDGALIGFVCAFADEDTLYGTLIDNLHVAAARKAGGIGRALMHDIAGRIAEAVPDRPVHLFVKAANLGARGFYARIGGESVEEDVHVGPDGSRSPVLRILWPSPAALLRATEAV